MVWCHLSIYSRLSFLVSTSEWLEELHVMTTRPTKRTSCPVIALQWELARNTTTSATVVLNSLPLTMLTLILFGHNSIADVQVAASSNPLPGTEPCYGTAGFTSRLVPILWIRPDPSSSNLESATSMLSDAASRKRSPCICTRSHFRSCNFCLVSPFSWKLPAIAVLKTVLIGFL